MTTNNFDHIPDTLTGAIRYFGDADKCHEFMVAMRWYTGVRCPHCGSENIGKLVLPRRIWNCKACHRQFTVKVGTIFEDSPLGLDKWLPAMWLILNCKNGISSCEIARALDVTQKTAWFMLHRIRLAQQGKQGGKLSGEVEVDETFIGGKARNMHKAKRERVITGTGGKDKTAVLGILERGGKVRTKVVDNTKKKTLQSEIREHVLAGSALFTD